MRHAFRYVGSTTARTALLAASTVSASSAFAQNAPLPIVGPDAEDAVPGISDGVSREVFETASVAAQSVDRRDVGDGANVWGQVIVRGAEQDALSALSDGYDSDQLIFTLGADFQVSDDIRVGLVGSYADISNQDLRADVAPTETSEADSFNLGAYAVVSVFDRGLFSAEFAYLTGEAETARSGAFGPIVSDFGFDGFYGRATLSYDIIPDQNVSVIPSIGVNFARVNFDDTQEVGGFNFFVERGDAEYGELRGGLTFVAKLSEGVQGFASGTIIRDLEGSTRSFRLSSTQLPTFSAVMPRRDLDRFELTAGVSVDLTEYAVLDLGYHGDFNEGYGGHAVRASVRLRL